MERSRVAYHGLIGAVWSLSEIGEASDWAFFFLLLSSKVDKDLLQCRLADRVLGQFKLFFTSLDGAV